MRAKGWSIESRIDRQKWMQLWTMIDGKGCSLEQWSAKRREVPPYSLDGRKQQVGQTNG